MLTASNDWSQGSVHYLFVLRTAPLPGSWNMRHLRVSIGRILQLFEFRRIDWTHILHSTKRTYERALARIDVLRGACHWQHSSPSTRSETNEFALG